MFDAALIMQWVHWVHGLSKALSSGVSMEFNAAMLNLVTQMTEMVLWSLYGVTRRSLSLIVTYRYISLHYCAMIFGLSDIFSFCLEQEPLHLSEVDHFSQNAQG